MKKIHNKHMKIPPLKSLRCFVYCAKNNSFTKTASALNLTQGAVSKQIALLEDFLGIKLFERKYQALILTKSAKIYLKQVEAALKNIELASAKIINRTRRKEVLNINVLPSMSSRWLISHLKDFRSKFPDYDVVVKTGDGEIDFDKVGCDLAIRVAQKKNQAGWKKLASEKIMGEELLCICSPGFRRKNNICEVKDLLSCNLLAHTYRPLMWQEYLKSFGLKKTRLKHDNSFEHFFMLIEAAKSGFGVGLVPRFLIEKELKRGELVVAVKSKFKSNYQYFLLWRKQKNIPAKIGDFAEWIKSVI